MNKLLKTLLLVLLPILLAKIIYNNFWHSVGIPKLKFCIYFSLKFQYKSKMSQRSAQQKYKLKLSVRIIQKKFVGLESCWKNYWIIVIDNNFFWSKLLIIVIVNNFLEVIVIVIDNKKLLLGWQSGSQWPAVTHSSSNSSKLNTKSF